MTKSNPNQYLEFDGDLSDQFFLEYKKSAHLAVDIETTGLNWTSDKIGLIQIYNRSKQIGLLRPLQNVKPVNFLELMQEPSIIKIFHHGIFDIRFMIYNWGAVFKNIACTKIMSKILHPNQTSHSLQDLLNEHLGITLNKDVAIRVSNWSSHNLTAEQVEYATKDVLYLFQLYQHLSSEIKTIEEKTTIEESFKYLYTRALLEVKEIKDVYLY